jgi:hypothetical protein
LRKLLKWFRKLYNCHFDSILFEIIDIMSLLLYWYGI